MKIYDYGLWFCMPTNAKKFPIKELKSVIENIHKYKKDKLSLRIYFKYNGQGIIIEKLPSNIRKILQNSFHSITKHHAYFFFKNNENL